MTDDDPGIEPNDAAAVDAFETALRAFAGELNRIHIAHGAPSYSVMAGASVRPRLTRAGLNEMLTGKRFSSLEALLEFVRVVTIPPSLPPAAATGFRADPVLVAAWRARWQEVKLLQHASHPARKRLRATVRQSLDAAAQEAEALREDARTDAERLRAAAEAEAARIRAQARHEAEQLLHHARRTTGQDGPPTHEGTVPHPPKPAAGAGGLRRAAGLVLRPALRPLTAASAVAALALAAVLAGDSLTGTHGLCPPGQSRAGGQLMPRAGLPGRETVQRAAFAKPADIIFMTNLKPADFPKPSSSPQTATSPTSAPTTPSPTPTPSPAPTPSPTPTVTPCAPQARNR